MVFEAVQHLRKMRGGAQSHLLRCSDGNCYVVKFQNNGQHPRVLVNDWLGSQVAGLLGLPVPETAFISVTERLLRDSPGLRLDLVGTRTEFVAGLSFGSRYVISPLEGRVYDYVPESLLSRIRNIRDFAGILAFDKWTCNSDGRQVAFWRRSRERKLRATFIDQGFCFNAGEWYFADAPLRGVFQRNEVYLGVTSWQCFEPWLSRIENFPGELLRDLAEQVPLEWYGAARSELRYLIERLVHRRSRVRELILDFKKSSRNPFPNWKEEVN